MGNDSNTKKDGTKIKNNIAKEKSNIQNNKKEFNNITSDKNNKIINKNIKIEIENNPEINANLKKIDEKLYLDFKLYLNNINSSTNDILLKEKINNNSISYQIINEYQTKEKRLFAQGNNDIIYNYFLCKEYKEFHSNDFLDENKKITDEFRYFSLYLLFGSSNNNMLNFYSKIFLNICKILSSSIIDSNINQQKCLKHINTLKDSLEWIYIIPCFEFIILKDKLIKTPQVNSFIIHCHGKHKHNNDYFNSFNKYKGIFQNHKELIELLKNINKKYICPKFNYELKNPDKYEIYNFSLGSNIQSKIKNDLRVQYENCYYNLDMSSSICNKFNQLLIKKYFYFKNIYENKIKIEINEISCFFNFLNLDNNISSTEKSNLCKKFIPKLFLVVYYYLSYTYSNPFKFSIDEIKNITSKVNENTDKNKIFHSIGEIINKCYQKIINKESILNEQIINNFHELLIKLIIIEEGNYNIYQYLEALSDFDFCLEFIFSILYNLEENNKKLEELYISMIFNDKRMSMVTYYMDVDEYNNSKNLENTELTQNQINEWTEGLKIKNILIIYNDNDFYNKIKSINFPYRTVFLKPEELDNFLEQREKDNSNRRIMKYYVIIDIKTGNDLYNSFNYYIFTYGLSLIFIFYCKPYSLIAKKLLLFGKTLSCICVCSTKAIEDYFYDLQKVYKFPIAINFKETRSLLGIVDDTAKQLFPQINNNEKEDDNGFDIIKDINPCIFISNYIVQINNNISLYDFSFGLYDLYKENNALDLYFKYFSIYLGFVSCFEEQLYNHSLLKQIIYFYTREEQKINNKNISFYSLMNNELRSGDFKKIKKYSALIYTIKDTISIGLLSSYNQEVYRGTWLKLDFIKKLKKGTKIFSPCFWSCSKDKKKAMDFLINYERNALLVVNGIINNNIDIDTEKLSNYPDEREVLILPFNSFEVKNIQLIFDPYNYYIINLEYIDEKYENDKIMNMPVYNINMDKIIDKLEKLE